MFSETFMTSLLTFYLKGTITTDGRFLNISVPNTILSVIPLGKSNTNIPVNQISNVSTDFRLALGRLIVGTAIAVYGLISIFYNFLIGLLLLVLGGCMVINSFQTEIDVQSTGGQIQVIPVLIFEKSKAEKVAMEINGMIAQRLDDTNVAFHTDRSIRAQEMQAANIVDAIASLKQ